MTIDLRGRPIAITGASSGIGWATALACAGAGMPVAVSARRADRLEKLVEHIRSAGGRALAVGCDVTKAGDCDRLIERTRSEFGSVYGVFANAGHGLYQSIADTGDAQMREIFEVNFFGTLAAVRPALGPLRAAGAGHILVCSSCLSRLALPWHGAYSATKAAQEHIARALRVELHGTGVYVSTVHPVSTTTEFSDASRKRAGQPARPARSPVRTQSPEHVAAAILRCLRRPRPEVWTSQTTRVMFAVASLLPRTTDRVLRSRSG
ncbi:MAG: SDR family NAD(P)-dependent oxidoreductase [Phycisphaerales bacterium]|nr:SDR family NAD(P)-dependent oxidoreductase [Phycisphaerales bacterium]